MIHVYLDAIPGLDKLRISINDAALSTDELNATLKSKLPEKVAKRSIIATTNGSSILKHLTVKDLLVDQHQDYINLHLRIPMCGGKGGFGSALKKNGSKMNSKRHSGTSNTADNDTSRDNYRTLTGMKLKTLKKLEKLEQLKKKDSTNFNTVQLKKINEKKEKLMKILNMDPELISRKDSKFDDSKYLDDLDQVMEEIRESVGSALDTSSDDADGYECETDDGYGGDIDHETDDTDGALTDYSIGRAGNDGPDGRSVMQGSSKDLRNRRIINRRRLASLTAIARRDDPTTTTDDYLDEEDETDVQTSGKTTIGYRVDSFFD